MVECLYELDSGFSQTSAASEANNLSGSCFCAKLYEATRESHSPLSRNKYQLQITCLQDILNLVNLRLLGKF